MKNLSEEDKMKEKTLVINIFKVIIILSAVIGVILNSLAADEHIKQFAYFTLQSNILVAVVYTLTFCKFSKSRIFLLIKNQATVAIVLTGIVFNLMLRPYLSGSDYNPNTISDFLVHVLTPILVLMEFIIFSEHGLIKRYDSLYWLIFPFIYWIFTLVFVGLGGNFDTENYQSNYPYFFLNFQENGILWFLLVLVFIVLTGYLLYFLDRKLVKNKDGGLKDGSL